MNFNECMDFISSYSRLGAKVNDLSRASDLMKKLGNPQNDLKFIHIAGTNGKGSTLEYIANALEYSGYKTGKFTSPYVTHYTDRIRINSNEIDEKSLGEICEIIKSKADNKEYSQFEINMAIAFLWYKREKCDIVVLETGIGGLLDSTNIIPSPILSIITSISLDHTAILGNTVEEIARQKAGIIKENSAVILSIDNEESVTEIVRKTAENLGAEFIFPCKSALNISYRGIDHTIFVYKNKTYKTGMTGFHQAFNAVSAIETCQYLRKKNFIISEENLHKALETASVKARIQIVNGNPPVIVDGGHNKAGVGVLSAFLYEYDLKDRKKYTVMGMVDSKDYSECVKIIAKFSDKIFCVDGFTGNSVNGKELSEIASNYTVSEVCELSKAVENAKKLALENNGIVVVCGSLYLASEYLNNFI